VKAEAEVFAMANKKMIPPLKVGDLVRIRQSILRGRIVEERGPLGPGGMLIYRVRIPRKPKSSYIEVRADQLERTSAPPKVAPSLLLTAGAAQSPKAKTKN
jgi:hypothetical protein